MAAAFSDIKPAVVNYQTKTRLSQRLAVDMTEKPGHFQRGGGNLGAFHTAESGIEKRRGGGSGAEGNGQGPIGCFRKKYRQIA